MSGKWLEKAIVIALLSVFAAAAIGSMRRDSPVSDEVSHHIGNGYSFLKTGDFRLNSGQPPLIEELAALPLLFMKPDLPLSDPSWRVVDRQAFGYKFLYGMGNDAGRIMFRARLVMVILGLLCGFLTYVLTKGLYGTGPGILALFLYAFSPNIIAYSRLVTADIGVTLFIMLAIYRFMKLIRKPRFKNISLSGLSLGLALASKNSAILLLPLFTATAVFMSISEKRMGHIWRLISITLIAYLTVFAAYFGEIKPLLKNDIDVPEKIAYITKAADTLFPGNEQFKNGVVDFALNVPVPLATYVMNILSSVNMIFVKPFKVFLFGKYSNTSTWYYFPAVFLLKTTIPVLVMILLTFLFRRGTQPKETLAEKLIIYFILAFSFISLFTKCQLSIRYILPVYPFLFIMISRLTAVTSGLRRAIASVVIGLSLWHAASSIGVCPHYLAYFNSFAGGPDGGWRYLRDANIDYGQDLPELADFMRQNNINSIKLAYVGSADPGYYGIKFIGITEAERTVPGPYMYAISVNDLDSHLWTKRYKPSAKAGYSIFIYDFRGDGNG